MLRLKATLYLSSLLVISVTCFYYLVFHPFIQMDPQLYSAFTNHKAASMPKTVLDLNGKVVKDIWTEQKGEISHHRLEAETAKISLYNNQKGKFVAKETFSKPKIWLREGPLMRYLTSKQAIFFYDKELLVAEDATFTLYETPDRPFELLKEKKQLQGSAGEVLCSLDSNIPKVTAKKLSATLGTNRGTDP